VPYEGVKHPRNPHSSALFHFCSYQLGYRLFYETTGTCRLNDKGEIQVSNPYKDESTNVRHRGGQVRMSYEATVMVVEQRDLVKQSKLIVN
jgi:hypothetical protein